MSQNNTKSVFSQVPNSITSLGLISGLLAIVFAFRCQEPTGCLTGYQWCWIFIGISLVCDFLDGFCARMLHAYSELGKNLDSLSDLVTFGLAPCFLIYNLIAEYHPDWSFVTWLPFLIPVTGAFRLANFNIDPTQKTVFHGLPIPANAIFWVGFSPFLIIHGDMPAWIATFAILAISFLMVTPLPMFSLKADSLKLNLENGMRLVMIVATILLVIFLGVQGLMWTIFIYIFLSFCSFAFLSKK